MPIDQETTTNVVCDNPNCPGHPDLDPTDLTGWTIVNHEVYGEPSAQHVFGNAACVNAVTADVPEGGAWKTRDQEQEEA